VSALRFLQGRANYSMVLERYEVVPPNIQQDIVAKQKVAA
jgi:elongation factor G